jgi:hypothetical protein
MGMEVSVLTKGKGLPRHLSLTPPRKSLISDKQKSSVRCALRVAKKSLFLHKLHSSLIPFEVKQLTSKEFDYAMDLALNLLRVRRVNQPKMLRYCGRKFELLRIWLHNDKCKYKATTTIAHNTIAACGIFMFTLRLELFARGKKNFFIHSSA